MKWVRIVGVVVAVEDFKTRRLYTIDDSSGTGIVAVVTGKYVSTYSYGAKESNSLRANGKDIPQQRDALKEQAVATEGAHIEFPYNGVDVGAVVYIKGSLTTFAEEKQVKVEKLVHVQSTTEEVVLWEKRNKFYTDVLAKPWVLSSELVQMCRRQAEKSEERAEKRKNKPSARAQAEQEQARQDEQSNKTLHREGPQKQHKRRHTALQRSEIAKMIHDGGVKGKFSALGL